jgi:arylsulfatase A-like enzyme
MGRKGQLGMGALACLVVCALIAASLYVSSPAVPTARASERRPNILVIVSDDQSPATVLPMVMPTVYQRMGQEGRWYPNYTDAYPLCAPSRASMLTGQYDHNNGQMSNVGVHFNEAATVECYLHAAGYRTGIFGKMLNGWPMYRVHHRAPYYRSPRCTDDSAINAGGLHAGLRFVVNGSLVHPSSYAYSDDYSLSRAVRYLNGTEAHDHQPWFLYFATTYPHNPYQPRPQHSHDLLPEPPLSPAVGEDVSDKPIFIQHHQVTADAEKSILNEERMLETVDSEVKTLFARMNADGEAKNTLVIYVSDNGLMHGEHGLWDKSVPYTPSIEAPFYLRWPGHIAPGTTSTRFASNVDIAPTILAAARAHPRLLAPMDGRSLLASWSSGYAFDESSTSCFTGPRTACGSAWLPNWTSVRTATYQYVEWRKQGHLVASEYYDLTTDPDQLTNLLNDGNPADDPSLAGPQAALRAFRHCAGRSCPR